MRPAFARLSVLAFLIVSTAPGAASSGAGQSALSPADLKALSKCESSKVSVVEVPEQCGVRFEMSRFGTADSAFVVQYTKPPQWLTDGGPAGVFWPPPDSKYHAYPQQTDGAFQPRPSGRFQVRVIGVTRHEGEEPPPKELLLNRKTNLFCMARVNRVTYENRVYLNFFAKPTDERPNTIVQAILEGGGPGQRCGP